MSLKHSALRLMIKVFRLNILIPKLNGELRKCLNLTRGIQYRTQWFHDHPKFFDHTLNLYSVWFQNRDSSFLDRGFFSRQVIRRYSNFSGKTLDLCCGDGFFSYYFYSMHSEHILAVDNSDAAIAFAKRNYNSENISFELRDILVDFPPGDFDAVSWDASIHYFDIEEINALLKSIKNSLFISKGQLSGSTISSQTRSNRDHKTLIRDMVDLKSILGNHFRFVNVYQDVGKHRNNLFFVASDFEFKMTDWKV
jgi:SAM-dependent methyltransferase